MLGLQLYLLLLYCWQVKGYLLRNSDCSSVMCRPGRECRSSPADNPHCACVVSCPQHWKPVCGSDGVSYDNHCELHRSACVSGSHVSPLHAGFCRKDREKVIARQEFVDELSLWNDTEDVKSSVLLPTACFENDRNRLREFIISWFLLNSKKQSWYSHGMSYAEELWGHFYSMDTNEDKFLDSTEMLEYLNKNKTDGKHGKKNNQLRQLCLDALVEEGDKNYDWRLSYREYKDILAESFTPSAKLCSLNGRMYEDGAETVVECNGCVCACGKWICTSEKCPEGHADMLKKISNNKFPIEDSEYDESEEDDEYDDDDDDEYPEDDPDVQDINWF